MSRVLNIASLLTPNMGGRFLCPKKQGMLPTVITINNAMIRSGFLR
jgi:hypothetical protein